MRQLVTSDERAAHGKSHARRSKYTARPSEPARQVRSEIRISPRRQLVRPEILPPSIRQGAGQLRQGDADTGRDEGDKYDAVDDEDGPAGIDARDQSGRDAEPRVGQGEADPQHGPDGKVALHVLRVAHLGELEGVGIKALEVGAHLAV